MYGAAGQLTLQWGCTWYALFFRSRAAHSACVQEQRSLWRQCAPRSATKVTVMPSYGNTKPDSIATHAFCVRVRFKLFETQAVAQPLASASRGASRPSASPPWSGLPCPTASSNADCIEQRASATTHPSDGHGSHTLTPKGQHSLQARQPANHNQKWVPARRRLATRN